ncbi:MAG: insulinase family protein [Cytophagales bacterium]|nr:insulinase family protein [Cytophaga sp.]
MTQLLDRTIAPDINAIDRFHLPQVETVSFSNGNTLHMFALGKQPVVRVEWIFNAGSTKEEKNGTSFFATKMLSEGTGSYSAAQIQEHLAQFGAFLEVHPGNDRTNITLYSLEKHLKSLIPFIKHLLTESTFPEEELNKIKQMQSQSIQVNLEKTSYLAGIAYRELLFGKVHPYGKQIDQDIIAAIQQQDLISFFKQQLLNKRCDIIITGGYESDAVDLLERYFGKDAVSLPSSIHTLPTTQPHSREIIIEKEGSVQSSLRYGRLLFNHTHADYFDAYILNEILGGYFGSRLMQNIREDKGYTYGIHSSIVNLHDAGYFVIGTDVKRENTKNTIEEIEKELQLLITEPVSADELQTVKSYMLGSFVGDIQTPFSVADKFKTIYFNGLGYDYYDRFFNRIKSITAEELQSIAGTYFKPDAMSYVVAGGL